jgi:heme-degrading monooxygenase HmoA
MINRSASTPNPPYYAAIFTSRRTSIQEGYDEMNALTLKLVQQQKGFLGSESFRNETGFGVTIAYFETAEDIRNWKMQSDHLQAQQLGKEKWYDHYKVRICKVERDYEFNT